jgi:hypothetical protein
LFHSCLKRTTVYRVDTDVVTKHPFVRGRVESWGQDSGGWYVSWSDGTAKKPTATGRRLVLAAGAWVRELVGGLDGLTAKQGVSFRLSGDVAGRPFILPWAPYKQVVVHQQGPNELWAGDGTAIIPKNWTEATTATCLARCLGAVPAPTSRTPLQTRLGLRPYLDPVAKTDPCFLREIKPGAWVVTGAGKSGTISAGWAARRLLQEFKAS